MKVDLSKSELELLDTALQKLEVSTEPELLKYAMENATILHGDAGPQVMNSAFNQIKDKVLGMLSTRRRQCTLMRAKLFQAAAAESEHDLSESPVTPPRSKSES